MSTPLTGNQDPIGAYETPIYIATRIPENLQPGQLVVARNRLDAELARTVREGELTQAAEHDQTRHREHDALIADEEEQF